MLVQSVTVNFLPNRAGDLVAAGAGAPLLIKGEVKEKDCEGGAGVSNAENLWEE